MHGVEAEEEGLDRDPELRAAQDVLHRLPGVAHDVQAAQGALVGVAHRPEAAAAPHSPEEMRMQRQLWQAQVRRVVLPWQHVHGQRVSQRGQQLIRLLQRCLQARASQGVGHQQAPTDNKVLHRSAQEPVALVLGPPEEEVHGTVTRPAAALALRPEHEAREEREPRRPAGGRGAQEAPGQRGRRQRQQLGQAPVPDVLPAPQAAMTTPVVAILPASRTEAVRSCRRCVPSSSHRTSSADQRLGNAGEAPATVSPARAPARAGALRYCATTFGRAFMSLKSTPMRTTSALPWRTLKSLMDGRKS
mmetsp:Transcript_104652/g.337419  ORF Transcript_104652/g.337419 Transcript_104652/m.337419 type:complete len:304 (-) Transcript_104652:14-925(-)